MKKIIALLVLAVGLFGFTKLSTTDYFEIAKNLDLFVDVYKNLNTFYVDEVDPEKMITLGIDAMLEELDPYSDFIPSEEVEQFTFQSTGEYGGIGATIQKVKDYVTIVSPYEGAPADEAGLRSGDRFEIIDGEDVKGKSSDEVVKLLKGQPGTKVQVTIGRGDQVFERSITRELIKIKNVTYSGLQENGIGYIKLSSFTDGAGDEVAAAIESLREQGEVKGLVLDLKGNGGGLLNEAIAVTNVFIPKGETVVTIKTRDESRNQVYKTMHEAVDTETPLVVLIDRGTASASEIVSGTIQDLDRGVVVGRNSFGKGLVQSTRDLDYNTKLKLTTAKYLIPSGRCVQRINYAEKDEDGVALEVPDSLRQAFTTRNGRTVYDGSGVDPDVTVESSPYSAISFYLFAKNYYYDYSLLFKDKHATIAPASTFSLTDDQYNNFVDFLADKDLDYDSEIENELEKVISIAKKENQPELILNELNKVQSQLKQNKKNDLQTYKEEIKFLLEREISSRYYYTAGRIENGIDNDDEYKQARELLLNLQDYQKILNP